MKIIIIGGIAAGMSSAFKLKRTVPNSSITVYEKSSYISFGACGLPYYVGGFFDNPDEMFARTIEQAKKAGINVINQHEVIDVNTKSKSIIVKNLKNNNEFEEHYDKLIIASGASPIKPKIEGIELENIEYLHSFENGQILKEKLKQENIQKVAIIGAGFIGIEMIDAIHKLGKKAVLFEKCKRILQKVFDQDISDLLEKELEEKKVKLVTQANITRFIGQTKVEIIQYTIDDKQYHENVDLVIIAIGVKPNTQFIQNSNIAMQSNGAIKVNELGQTSIEDIYAAGDCATIPHRLIEEPQYIPLATNANKLGRVIGDVIANIDTKYLGSLGSSCVKVLDLEAGRTGLSEEDARKLGIEYKTTFIKDYNHTNYYPGRSEIYIKLIYDQKTNIILGGQVIGKNDAIQRTNVLATAIFAKLTTKQLGMLDLCYSPPFSRTWDVLNVVGNVSK